MSDNNKVKYGLKNVYYAVATIDASIGTATYETPVKWPGAVNLSMDASGDTNKFRADNMNYFTSQGNDGYEGDLETARVPDSFKKDVLGFVETEDGVLLENADAISKPFALLFEFDGDKNKVRHVFYNCSASRPSVASQTTEATITPVTETIGLTAGSIYNAVRGINITKGSVAAEDAPYSTWFNSVYQETTTP